MGVFKDALESVKKCRVTTDEVIVKLSDEDYEAFKELVWTARTIHRQMQKKGGTRRVLRGFDLARESMKANQEASGESGDDEMPSILSE